MQTVHRRQFLITSFPYQRDDFKQITLKNGMILSYQEDLHIAENPKEGIYLLGWAFSVNGDRIELTDGCDANRRYWSGRWILIYKEQIFMDCCGTLGCYYQIHDHSIIISSSLPLLNSIQPGKEVSDYKVKYGDGNGMLDYYPIPCTPVEGTKKLLPSQFFDLSRPEYVVDNRDYLRRSYAQLSRDELKREIIQEFEILIKNIYAEFGDEIWIPLTAGYDSRCLLAVAKKSEIPVSVYTILRSNIKPWDKNVPMKIARKLRIPHLYLDDNHASTALAVEREVLFDCHTGGYIVGTERRQFISDVDVPVKSKAIVLWGTVWAAYIKAYQRTMEAGTNTEDRLEIINKACGGIVQRSNVHACSLTEWLQKCEENPMRGIDWRERLYFEQRNGSWVSCAAQAFDLFDSERIAPVNCTDLLELLLSLDVAPGDKSIQKEIVSACCPEIRNVPYGEPTDLLYRIRRKIKRKLTRWSKHV